jgi:hypothetical protein
LILGLPSLNHPKNRTKPHSYPTRKPFAGNKLFSISTTSTSELFFLVSTGHRQVQERERESILQIRGKSNGEKGSKEIE